MQREHLQTQVNNLKEENKQLQSQNKKLEEDVKDCNKWGEEWKQHYDRVLSQLSAFRGKVDVGKIDKILEKEGHIVDWGYKGTKDHTHYVKERQRLAHSLAEYFEEGRNEV